MSLDFAEPTVRLSTSASVAISPSWRAVASNAVTGALILSKKQQSSAVIVLQHRPSQSPAVAPTTESWCLPSHTRAGALPVPSIGHYSAHADLHINLIPRRFPFPSTHRSPTPTYARGLAGKSIPAHGSRYCRVHDKQSNEWPGAAS